MIQIDIWMIYGMIMDGGFGQIMTQLQTLGRFER